MRLSHLFNVLYLRRSADWLTGNPAAHHIMSHLLDRLSLLCAFYKGKSSLILQPLRSY
jgi:hypothetical protein